MPPLFANHVVTGGTLVEVPKHFALPPGRKGLSIHQSHFKTTMALQRARAPTVVVCKGVREAQTQVTRYY